MLVTVRTGAQPFGAADSSDLGVALVSLASLFEDAWTAETHVPGSNERLQVELAAGDYYLAVADEAGVATRYGLCIAVGNDCTLPAAPPSAVARTWSPLPGALWDHRFGCTRARPPPHTDDPARPFV